MTRNHAEPGFPFASMNLKGSVIRRMAVEDLDEVLSLSALPFLSPWSKHMFLEEMRNSFSHCFVAKMKETTREFLIGFICFRIIGDESELLNLCVHPGYRRLGMGKKLMRFYINFCNKSEIKTFYLEVDAANQPALHLYRIFSYQPLGTRKKFYREESDALIMGKKA